MMRTRSMLVISVAVIFLSIFPSGAQSTYDGIYQGTYSGGERGTWQMFIKGSGVEGWFMNKNGDYSYEVIGTISGCYLEANNYDEDVQATGTINQSKVISGKWKNFDEGIAGTFTGKPVVTLKCDQVVKSAFTYDGNDVYYRIEVPAGCGMLDVMLDFTGSVGCHIYTFDLYDSSDFNASPILSDNTYSFPKRLTLMQPKAGVYYLAMIGASLSETKKATVALSASYKTAMWDFMEDGEDIQKVSLILTKGASNIQNGVSTWVVIHGKNDNPTTFMPLATNLDGLANGAQVLLVDWSAAAKGKSWPVIAWATEKLDLTSTRWIVPAANKLAPLLQHIGAVGSHLDIVGHSWGTYMEYEIGKRVGIRRLVALDPAMTGLGYEETAVNFGAVAQVSYAFHSGFWFGNPLIPLTADQSIVVGTKRSDSLGTTDLAGHCNIIDIYNSVVSSNRLGRTPDQISARFSPNAMGSFLGWMPNKYDAVGTKGVGGGYDAILLAPNKKTPTKLWYYNGYGIEDALPKVSSGGGGSMGEI